MKLKTPAAEPAPATAPRTPASGAPFPPPAREPSRSPFSAASSSAHPLSDPFLAFVRKTIARSNFSPLPSDHATNVVNGAVIAEAQIDGVRYVMIRCEPKPGEALLSLSPRERDIVNLIIKGYPNKTIADLLDISAWTVGTYLRRIFAKLGVTSRAAMVAKYLHQLGG